MVSLKENFDRELTNLLDAFDREYLGIDDDQPSKIHSLLVQPTLSLGRQRDMAKDMGTLCSRYSECANTSQDPHWRKIYSKSARLLQNMGFPAGESGKSGHESSYFACTVQGLRELDDSHNLKDPQLIPFVLKIEKLLIRSRLYLSYLKMSSRL